MMIIDLSVNALFAFCWEKARKAGNSDNTY